MTGLSNLQVPNNEKKVLLHCCCAPCSCSILRHMIESGIEPTVYFYNPNIYPREEYELRKREVLRFVQKIETPIIDADHETELWFSQTKDHEEDTERGERCRLCFEMRLNKAAACAQDKGFKIFTTSLGISRWKDLEQVTRAGKRAALLFPGLIYWDYNWRLHGGQEDMERISKQEGFYRQRYCGCLFSLRDSIKRNLSRLSEDQPAR